MPPMSSVPNHVVGRNGGNLLGQPVFHAPPTGTGLNPNNVQIQPHPLAPTINNMTIQTFPNFLIPIQPPQMNGQTIPTLHLGIATSFIPLPPPPRMVHPQSNNNSVGVPSSMMFTRPPGWSMVPVFSSANSVPPTGGRPRMAVPQSGNGFHGQQRSQSLPQVFLHGSAPGNYGGTGARFSVPVSQHGNGFHGQATPNQVPQVVQSNNQSTLQK
ncbi:unnamed protein product [Orchesella dallaii]|uniref:Uncharacterized protein n=1 Tax=Orchesella dallaii TaxID=48710 RepID=A0ABP1PVL9_9HEXA